MVGSQIVSGVDKAVAFLVNIFTKTSTVASQVSKLSGPVLAAMLAVFYDVVKTAQAADTAVATAQAGNFPAAFALSETTVALLKSVVADFKAGEQLIVADLQALKIIPAK